MSPDPPDRAPVIDPAVQRLLDESQIRAVVVRYARAIDRIDFDLLRSCYHPDAIDDHGIFNGTIDEFVAFLSPRLHRHLSSTHFLGNHEVVIEGDVAFAETVCIASQRDVGTDGGPEEEMSGIVRYCDRFERRDGEWRIAHRIVIHEPGRFDDIAKPTRWNGRGIRQVSPDGLLRPGPVSTG